MAKKTNSRRTHVSPGVYYKETELQYATKSLGITTLGLAGETVKGPAFQPISIENWREFQTYFGGTNPEKFRGSQYPKFEAPYIAKEYLKQSKKLEVVRTLGLSGVNAGPAWVITATKYITKNGYKYSQYVNEDGETDCNGNFDINEDNYNKTYFFKLPAEIATESEVSPYEENEINLVDAFVNGDFDIVYFDDYQEEFYDTLPKQMQEDYSSVAAIGEALTEIYGSCDSFMYISLENGLTDGKLCITYNDTFMRSFDIKTETGIGARDTERKSYIILTKDDFTGVDDFVYGKFSIRQYGYTNEIDNEAIVSNTGLACKYKANDTPETIYVNACDSEDECEEEFDNIVIGVLRSRGEHKRSVLVGKDECENPIYTYDGIEYYAKNVSLIPSTTLRLGDSCTPDYNTVTGDFNIDTTNYGRFTIAVDSVKGCETCGVDKYIRNEYSVSLNPNDKNYITKVIGTNPEVGDADVYVEELYDVALEQLIYAGKINAINYELVNYPAVTIIPDHEDVDDLLTMDASSLTKNDLNKRYLYTYAESLHNGIMVRVSTDGGLTWEEQIGLVGHIYTVISHTNSESGKKEYFYGEYRDADGGLLRSGKKFTEYLRLYKYYRDVVKEEYILRNCVRVASDDMYYIYTDDFSSDTANEGDVHPITLDFNNYKEEYRYASTPWIVSEMKGSGENVKLHKLFRFHTISDGNNANTEVKISIENIDPETETFDVIVRAFNDMDSNPAVLERFGKCGLVPGEDNYIGLKIGTIDETYVSQSAYITVEINEDDITEQSIPCGFLGYPVRNYNGYGIFDMNENPELTSNVKQPYIKFNTTVDEDINVKKQYFGMSDIYGIDADILSYKGVEAYNDDPEGLTPCFHLDARILNGAPKYDETKNVWYTEDNSGNMQVVNVDGVTGYNWVTVSRTQVLDEGIEPRIGLEEDMIGTIYEDKRYRKFTVCFYGGWDGWDYYRTSRSNGDSYRYNKYKGSINKVSGVGSMFSTMKNPEAYGFDSDEKVLNTDYYAYLAAIKQLSNPNTVKINLLATPGIDYVNQKSLVNDVISMVENERGDVLHVITTPDKPFGAGDSKVEMYTPDEVVSNLEDSEIDTNYACTYYPWGQYYDNDNSQYVFLPVTLDVVRNIAYTDNIAFCWYGSGGWNRGDVTCVAPRKKLKIKEEDVLYEGRINFVKSFAKEGDKIWGDKNLQAHDGIMNRISKRRLLLRLKELLSNASIGLIFDPNDNSMSKTLESSIKSVLDPIVTNKGITDYRIELDDSAEARDRLELPGKVWIKPTQLLEYIDLNLIVTPQGVSWE